MLLHLPFPSAFNFIGRAALQKLTALEDQPCSWCAASPGPGPPVYQVPISFPPWPGQTWQEALPSCTVTLLLPAGLALLGTRGCRSPPKAENDTKCKEKFVCCLILDTLSSNHPRLRLQLRDYTHSANAIAARQSHTHLHLDLNCVFLHHNPLINQCTSLQSVWWFTTIPVAPSNNMLQEQQYSFNPSMANSITSMQQQVVLFKMPGSIH